MKQSTVKADLHDILRKEAAGTRKTGTADACKTAAINITNRGQYARLPQDVWDRIAAGDLRVTKYVAVPTKKTGSTPLPEMTMDDKLKTLNSMDDNNPGDYAARLIWDAAQLLSHTACGCEQLRQDMNKWGWQGCWGRREHIWAEFSRRAKERKTDLTRPNRMPNPVTVIWSKRDIIVRHVLDRTDDNVTFGAICGWLAQHRVELGLVLEACGKPVSMGKVLLWLGLRGLAGVPQHPEIKR